MSASSGLLLAQHPPLTRFRRKSESRAQRVKKPATTIMMIDTAKSCFNVDRAAIQPLQREEVREGIVGVGPRVPMRGSSPHMAPHCLTLLNTAYMES